MSARTTPRARASRAAPAVLAAGLALATLPVGVGGAQSPEVDPGLSEPAAPAGAVAGWARGAGVFVPFHVNPNFDFWPAFSLSEIDGSASRGLSGGLWPGFLVDAFMWLFGYQEQGRAALGIAESLWPNVPHEAEAATTDLGGHCAQAPGAGFPDGPSEACRAAWEEHAGMLPFRGSSARSESGPASARGDAEVAGFALPGGATAGAIQSRSAAREEAGVVVSEAEVILENLRIGALHIRQLRSVARAVSDGTPEGVRAERDLEITGATLDGEEVEITSEGLALPGFGPLSDGLASEGFDVRLAHGRDEVDGRSAIAESGGLVIRMTRRPAPPSQFSNLSEDACRTLADTLADISPEPVASVPYDLGPNPLYEEQPPFDQTPRDLEGEEPIPPVVPCLGLLFERDADIGVVLGSAAAFARLQPLAAVDPPPPPGSRVVFETIVETIRGPETPPATLSPFEPFPGVPGLGEETAHAAAPAGWGEDLAAQVRLAYGLIVLALGLLVGGRAGFRSLTRP